MFIVIGAVPLLGHTTIRWHCCPFGYFPRILGGVMAVLGVIVAGITSQNQAQMGATEESAGHGSRSSSSLAVVLFGATLPSLGMVIAIILLTMLSGFAAHGRTTADWRSLR